MASRDGGKPIILREGRNSPADLEELRKEVRVWRETSVYEAQLEELFEITHPRLLGESDFKEKRATFVRERSARQDKELRGDWIYYPWSGVLVHSVARREYDMLRTNRNRNLITEEEQHKLSESCVGIVGLSVGSGVASALVHSGIADRMKLAEFDTLETTNLNRIRGRLDQIGMKKIDLLAHQLYETNPYLEFSRFPDKMDKDLLREFMGVEPKPRVVFEIIDSFETKIHLRTLARELRIPVIMVTNLGDRVLLDVERYDLDPNTEYFNGRAGKVPYDILENPDVSDSDKHRYAVELAGVEHIPKRALDSVAEIGKTLVGRPQLASTVTVSGGVCAYFARKIILGEDLPSCSWLVDLDEIFKKETAL